MRKISIVIVVVLLAIVIAMVGFLLSFEKTKTFEFAAGNEEQKNITIFFGGDIMLDRGIRYYAGLNGGNDFIFQKVSSFLSQNDLNILNLEGPITDNPSVSSSSKVGSTNNFIFTFDPSWAVTLAKNNIKLVGIGNNHILNFESGGVELTKNYLSKSGVDYFGEPNGRRSFVKEIQGVKIGFVAYNQFLENPAQEKNEVVAEIKKLKDQTDIVVVFCHWGIEYQKEASLEQQQFGRDFIDAGADAVFGAHPHVVEPIEVYKGKRIYYSLGNFIFDQYFSEDVRRGLGVIVSISPITKELNFEEKHFYLEKNGQTVLLP